MLPDEAEGISLVPRLPMIVSAVGVSVADLGALGGGLRLPHDTPLSNDPAAGRPPADSTLRRFFWLRKLRRKPPPSCLPAYMNW